MAGRLVWPQSAGRNCREHSRSVSTPRRQRVQRRLEYMLRQLEWRIMETDRLRAQLDERQAQLDILRRQLDIQKSETDAWRNEYEAVMATKTMPRRPFAPGTLRSDPRSAIDSDHQVLPARRYPRLRAVLAFHACILGMGKR